MYSSVLYNSVERGLSNPLCQTWLSSVITSELYTILPSSLSLLEHNLARLKSDRGD